MTTSPDLLDDEYQAEVAGAWNILRRGIKASPELRDGLVATVFMGLSVAVGRLTVPVIIQRALDAETLAEIGRATAKSARTFGFEPRVAFLSFSTRDSAKDESIDRVKQAVALVRKAEPDLLVDGEMQIDSAMVPAVAEKKCPDSPLEGKANVFIFPDLNAGNIAYRITERMAGAAAIGPILQGLRKPVNDVPFFSANFNYGYAAGLRLRFGKRSFITARYAQMFHLEDGNVVQVADPSNIVVNNDGSVSSSQTMDVTLPPYSVRVGLAINL